MSKKNISKETLISLQKGFYHPFCSDEEIDRVFDVKSADDYLLKVRADAVADHSRHYRVMRRRMNIAGDSWSFSNHFADHQFDNYLNKLKLELQSQCNNISRGFVFTTEPNGVCAKTPFGNVIMISESLKEFLFYMNLAHLDHAIEVPYDVRMHSQKIAIRVMLESEALDFDLDPRGIFPEGLEDSINDIVESQLEFVIGHEYAHHNLGHLNEANVITSELMHAISADSPSRSERIYSYSQQQEFEADIEAISALDSDAVYKPELVFGAISFFAFMDIFKSVKDQICPSHSFLRTHPDPIDRLWNIFNKYGEEVGMNEEYVDDLIQMATDTKKFLNKDVAINIESYEFYGSIYLGSWRGKELIDRVDYYF